MPFLNTLEKHYGRFAIPGLIRAVVALTAATFVLSLVNPDSIRGLVLDSQLILTGQAWRLVTWPFIPPTVCFFGFNLPLTGQAILMVFVLQCYWTFGEILEAAWGAFRLNLFFLCGMAGCIIAAFLFSTGGVTFTAFLMLSILFAVAIVSPNFQLLLFFILPVKIKWIALLSLIFLIFQFIVSPWEMKLVILLSFLNCLLFLGPEIVQLTRNSRQIAARRAKFQVAKISAETLHCCHVCGGTEISNPELDFRVSADGHEYCTAHLPAKTSPQS